MALLLRPEKANLGDTCAPLINAWQQLVLEPEGVFEALARIPFTEEEYYLLRSAPQGDRFEQAVRFIFLNRGAFNGLYRVNKAGAFNVPWGKHRTSFVGDVENFRAIAHWGSKSATFSTESFERSFDEAAEGDLIFADPPYAVPSGPRAFWHYGADLFSFKDQQNLALLAGAASRRGVKVMITNVDHPAVAELYDDFEKVRIDLTSTIAGSAAARGRRHELLFKNF